MSGPVPSDAAGGIPPRATDLIANVRTRDEALRQEAEHLVRLREAARTAAEQEATAIVAHARADIRRIIADARTALLALKSQLEEIAEPRPEVDAALRALGDELSAEQLVEIAEDDDQLPESVRAVQGELQRLFAESDSDLDALAAQASARAAIDAPPTAPSTAGVAERVDDRETGSAIETAGVDVDGAGDLTTPGMSQARGKRLLTIFGVMAGLSAAGAGAWWYAGMRPASDRQTTAVVIPRAPTLKVAPSAATEIPTVSGSLISLPLAQRPQEGGDAASVDSTPR